MISASYLHDCVNTKRLKRIIQKAIEDLTPFSKEFDGIAFRGMSGAFVGPPVAVALNKKLMMVRKGSSHSYHRVEGSKTVRKYIIIDDFVETGRTVKNIIKYVKVFNPKSIMVGSYLYSTSKGRDLKLWSPKTKKMVHIIRKR